MEMLDHSKILKQAPAADNTEQNEEASIRTTVSALSTEFLTWEKELVSTETNSWKFFWCSWAADVRLITNEETLQDCFEKLDKAYGEVHLEVGNFYTV